MNSELPDHRIFWTLRYSDHFLGNKNLSQWLYKGPFLFNMITRITWSTHESYHFIERQSIFSLVKWSFKTNQCQIPNHAKRAVRVCFSGNLGLFSFLNFIFFFQVQFGQIKISTNLFFMLNMNKAFVHVCAYFLFYLKFWQVHNVLISLGIN